MKKLDRISDTDLWNLGYNIAEMMKAIHMYFANRLRDNHGTPYNHINDGVEHQHHDLLSHYLKIKRILDPIFEKGYHKEQKYKIEKISKLCKEIMDEMKE